MDLTVFSRVEAIMTARGLAMQAGILDMFKGTFIQLVACLFVAGLFVVIFKNMLMERQVNLNEVMIYAIMCLMIWTGITNGALRVSARVSLAKLPPEQQKGVSEEQKVEIAEDRSINVFFAVFVWLLDGASEKASEMIAKAQTQAGYARVQGSLVQATAKVLQANLRDDLKNDTDQQRADNAKANLKRFFSNKGGDEPGCRYLWNKHAANIWDDHGNYKGMYPWLAATEMIYQMGLPPNDPRVKRIEEGYYRYQELMKNHGGAKKDELTPEEIKAFSLCESLPRDLHVGLFKTAEDYLNDEDMGYWVGDDEDNRWGEDMKPALRKELLRRVVAKSVWEEYSAALEDNHYWATHTGKLLGWAKEKFGIAEGAAKMSFVPVFATWLRGTIKMLLFAFFPFMALFLFLPSGWSWMMKWARMVVAVYIWQVLDVLNIAMIDNHFWDVVKPMLTYSTGLDLDLTPMIWAQGVIMGASPFMSYILAGVPGGGMGIGSAVSGSGLVGKVVKFAARSLARR